MVASVEITASDLVARVDAVLPGLLTPGLIESIAPALERRVLAPGAILFMEGDPSDAMYVTLRGSLRVSIAHPERGAVVVGHVGPGAPVGEMQILSGGTRTATVTAETESEIVRVPRIAFERVATEAPDVMRHLNDAIRRRVRRNQLVAILPSLFGPLDDQTLGEIEAAVTWVSLPRASTLFRQGDVGDAAYIVVNGRLRAVVRDAHGVEKTVGEIQRGETVGEMAIFTGEARSATVDAVRDSDLVRLDRPAFERLISARPQALLTLTRLTINRLRNVQSAAPVANPVIAVAIVAAGLHAPLAAFAARLATALGRIGPTAHLRASDLDCQLGTPGLAQAAMADPRTARIAAWIDDVEMHHRFLVLETDPTASNWGARCIRQADRVLIVARAGDDPVPGATERALLGVGGDGDAAGVTTSLVLIHPPGTPLPSGTKRWLAPRRLVRHHHVRDEVESDIERVARYVAGCAYGVALSGGGARGFAHIGVLQAIEEAGVPIDLIGGTSMGACISGEYALGWDPPMMVRQNRLIFGKWHRDLTLPLLSILGGHRSSARLREAVGDVQIEDLWLPYFCVSSNLSRAEMVIHCDGPLWLGLRASGGLPAILPPVVLDGDLLVDGGFLRNLPADIVCERLGGGTVIAVDVSSEHDLRQEYPYGDAISGWRVLWSRINPLALPIKVPSMAAVLLRAVEIASVAMQRGAILRGVDLYIRLPVQQYGMLDFQAAPAIIDVGYRAARTSLAEWLAATRRPHDEPRPSDPERRDFHAAVTEPA